MGKWQSEEVADCQVYSNAPEKCLAFICSFTAPTFTLLIEECCYGHFLEVWLAGILFSIQFTEKLLHILAFPLISAICKPPHSTWCNRFFGFFTLFIYLTVSDPSCGMQDLHCVMGILH